MNDFLQLPDGTTHVLRDGLVIGRHPTADLVLADESLSRAHARVTGHEGLWVLADLHSRNGTWVNETRLHPGGARPLHHDDSVRLGRLVLRASLDHPDLQETTTGISAAVLAKHLELSPYQRAVVTLLCSTSEPDEPLSNSEIARLLGTPDAVNAVKTAFSRIYARAGMSEAGPGKRRELRRLALEEHWIR